MDITYELIRSWADTRGNVNSNEEIRNWLESRKTVGKVDIKKIPFSYDGFWHYDEDEGCIRNQQNSFFQIKGYQVIDEHDAIVNEQPLIIQPEIGYLGIICKMIDGTLNFLMQAKIEPGNINYIQLSPTIQATKSNFTRMHGGTTPAYLEFFEESNKHHIIVDQVQSEQASRFYKKRNRNIIIFLGEDEDVPVYDTHCWMTLGQIKLLMQDDNIVNMDSRTVLSCIPFGRFAVEGCRLKEIEELFNDKALFKSIFKSEDIESMTKIFNYLNDFKMFNNRRSRFVPVKSLKGWQMLEDEIVCKTPYDYKIVYCRIEIEGREVRYWEQPLVEACGISVLGLFTTVVEGTRKYLVCVRPESGSFDGAELGPTIQLEPTNKRNRLNDIEELFLQLMEESNGIKTDVLLSEEGGRFYHEENRNVIIEIDADALKALPEGYFWVDFRTLNEMIQYNNFVNIQLRNLLSIIDM